MAVGAPRREAKAGVKRCGPGAARTVSAPRRESKSNERAPPKGKASAPEREEKATSAHRARRALPSVRGKATKKQQQQQRQQQQQQQQQHPHLANPTPSAKSLVSVFACKTSTPTQGSRQGQRQKVRAWSGAYLQRAKARQQKPGKSNGNPAPSLRHRQPSRLAGSHYAALRCSFPASRAGFPANGLCQGEKSARLERREPPARQGARQRQ